MSRSVLLLAFTAALALQPMAASARQTVSPAIAAAVADPDRPARDTARDELRRPADLMAFAGVEPGMRVIDLMPGGGYYTRILSRAVGPEGRVYAFQVAEVANQFTAYRQAIIDLAAEPAYTNITAMFDPAADFEIDQPVDMVFTALNYHDLHADFMGLSDVGAVNRAIFAALRPGGVYVINDHQAVAGSGLEAVNPLHRIDVEVVKQEVLAAGFVLDAESDILAHPSDDRTVHGAHPSMRGRTDQMTLRFRKPG